MYIKINGKYTVLSSSASSSARALGFAEGWQSGRLHSVANRDGV
jgi:hypothetical protein